MPIVKCPTQYIGSINERLVWSSSPVLCCKCLLKIWAITATIFYLFLCVYVQIPPPLWLLYLFGFILLMVAWRYQTVGIDAFITGRCVAMGTGVGLLHCQEGLDALYFNLETAVCEALAFGGQPTGSHPLSILLLLEGQRKRLSGAGTNTKREQERVVGLSEMWDSETKTEGLKERWWNRQDLAYRNAERQVCVCMWPHVFTAQINLIHALRRWYQESDKELLCGHVNVRSHFTSCVQDECQSNVKHSRNR